MATVLIVEDEGLLAMRLGSDLAHMGHEVIGIADNAADAFALTEKFKPDIILIDIVLNGDMNGIDAAVKISEMHDCKIIYMTAQSDEDTIERAQKTNHVGFLHKPFEPYQLKNGIERALQ